MTNKLDRITLGSVRNINNDENLRKEGEVNFKLYSKLEYFEFQRESFYDLRIKGKLSSGENIWSQHIASSKKIPTREQFLEEVNDDLRQMNSYLAEAKLGRRFPHFWLHKIEGILYKEQTKNC
jgi:hypothetical protein